MSFDNRIFNVNGIGNDQLKLTLQLVFAQQQTTCVGWMQTDKGLLLANYLGKDVIPFPVPLNAGLTADQTFPHVVTWLKHAHNMVYSNSNAFWMPEQDDDPYDFDGSTELGWRVYCQDWGYVDHTYVFCAVKPAYIWYGK